MNQNKKSLYAIISDYTQKIRERIIHILWYTSEYIMWEFLIKYAGVIPIWEISLWPWHCYPVPLNSTYRVITQRQTTADTSWLFQRRFYLQTLIIFQLVKKFPVFYESWSFISLTSTGDFTSQLFSQTGIPAHDDSSRIIITQTTDVARHRPHTHRQCPAAEYSIIIHSLVNVRPDFS